MPPRELRQKGPRTLKRNLKQKKCTQCTGPQALETPTPTRTLPSMVPPPAWLPPSGGEVCCLPLRLLYQRLWPSAAAALVVLASAGVSVAPLASSQQGQHHRLSRGAGAAGPSAIWQKLEEENADFFRAYYTRLKLKRQILLFNNLLEHQDRLMKHPPTPKVQLVPIQNGIHSMPVSNVPMGYPIMQQPAMPPTGQPNFDTMGHSSCHVVNGVAAPGNFHPMRVNSGNDAMPSMSEMAVSPTSVASNGHFPFIPSAISGIGMDSTVLDSAFTSDMGTAGGLQLGIDGGAGSSKDAPRSGGQLTWNFSFTDLAAEFTNLDDLGALGSYTGSPFLPDADIALDTDQDGMEDFLVDDEPSSPSDEEKP